MVTATITSKGQVTIPKEVRDSLHLHTGDRVAFLLQEAGCAVLKPVTRSVDQVFGTLHTPGGPARRVEDMDRAVARRMKPRRT
jgi:AbrB family looped-hinge helix DNA binding protein